MDQTDSVVTNINQIITIPSSANGSNNLVKRTNSAANKQASKENMLSNQSTNSQVSTDNVANTASKRPKNTALKQQRLPAWQPILTAKTVLPLFFTIGVIFVVLGGVLLHYSNIIEETVLDYTSCFSTLNTSMTCADINQRSSSATPCTCVVPFSLHADYPAPVFIYYGLRNFYQNHRRYVKSRDDNQLLGITPLTSVNSECSPYDKNPDGKFYAPCGAIANSLFNDTFSLIFNGPQQNSSVPLLATGIAWNTDKTIKFQNPSNWDNTVKPKNWDRPVWNLSSDPSNNGYQNEDLIVWMRTAALPTFRKFHRRVDHSKDPTFQKSLPAGLYYLTINYNFPTQVFQGNKSFIISTTTWIGGKNPFLGIAYLVVGSLCIFLGFLFLIIHFKFSRSPKNSDDVNSNNINRNGNVAVIESQNRN